MATETLRPNAAGDENSIYGQVPADSFPATDHYNKVDEASPDGVSTTVYEYRASYYRDLYNLPACSIPTGSTINSITVYFRCVKGGAQAGYAKPSIKSNSTVTDGTEITLTTGWVTSSQTWTTNPADSQAWEKSDIDALQIGVSLKGYDISNLAVCTQVYVVVDYTCSQAVGQGAITPTGALGRNIFISVGSGAITPTGALATLRKIFQSVGSGAITPVGTLGRKILLAVGSGAITPVGALGRKILLAVGSGAITPTGVLGRLIKIAVGGGSITPTGALGAIKRFIQSVGGGAITPIGTLGRLIKIGVGAGAITPTGALNRLIKLAVGSGAITPTGALNRLIKLVVGRGAITPSGALNRLIKITVGQGAITPVGALAAFWEWIKLTLPVKSLALTLQYKTYALTAKIKSYALTLFKKD